MKIPQVLNDPHAPAVDPHALYRCPGGHGLFYPWKYGASVCWSCPICLAGGVFVRLDLYLTREENPIEP